MALRIVKSIQQGMKLKTKPTKCEVFLTKRTEREIDLRSVQFKSPFQIRAEAFPNKKTFYTAVNNKLFSIPQGQLRVANCEVRIGIYIKTFRLKRFFQSSLVEM